jgi:hypothetical protein
VAEFIASEYHGGEGQLVNCKTGDELLPGVHDPKLSYRDKMLIVDKRRRFDVFDSVNNEWVMQLDLPVWQQKVYALKSELHLTKDSLIFKPPYHGRKASKSIDEEYRAEQQRSDHYLLNRTANRLMLCALSGDTLSARRLETMRNDFAPYFSAHEDSKKIFDELWLVYTAYR